jgi:4-methyl-5(b-hydroxyethyl)-thiazole monophosphate biosynthesis
VKKAIVLLADGFEEVEGITQIDFLRRAGIETVVAGVTGRDVVGGHDIRVNTDITLDEVMDDFDAIVLPGGATGAENIAADRSAVAMIQKALEGGTLVAAICASPGVILGANGLLGDRRFTCYPGFEKKATSGNFSEDRVVVDGNLITSRGPGTAAEFAEAIVTYLVDDQAARDLHEKTLQK